MSKLGNFENIDNPEQKSVTKRFEETAIPSDADRKKLKRLFENKKDMGNSAEKKLSMDNEHNRYARETGWGKDIINKIDSPEQYDIYKNANLHEKDVNGRKCLVKNIDYNYKDPKTGMTNRERMEKGRSPYDARTGEKIELHHMGQEHNSPFAELNENSEHGNGNHKILHPKTVGSWRINDAYLNDYAKEKAAHWKIRSQEG